MVAGALLLVGAAMLVAGALATVSARHFRVGLAVQAVGAAGIGLAGFWVFASGSPIGAGFHSALSPRLGVDPLSGFFLGTLGLVAAPVLVFSTGYLRFSGRGRAVGALTGVFVLVMAGVLCARDPVTLLGGWELMTLLPAAIILISHSHDDARRARNAVFTYVAVTHLGGAGTWISILLLAKAGVIDGAVLHGSSGLQTVVVIAALVGMGTKAGVMPLHVWLPRAHPIAPAPVSALMSGAMIKVAIYLLIRMLVFWAGPLPVWLGIVVMVVGALSALGGVTYALFEHDLKRLLAMHSIENIGIIVLGLGGCILLRARGQQLWAAFSLAAALLHTLNHAVFKSLLFLSAGAFERAAGVLDLGRLGGMLRRAPAVGWAFLVGSMAIAGLPPLNGFASEWLTIQSLAHVSRYGRVIDGVFGAAGLAALAATAALAAFCFVKVVGLVLLGPPRRDPPHDAILPSRSMGGSTLFLAVCCVVLGVAPGLLFARLGELSPWPVRLHTRIGLSLPSTGSLPTFWVAIVVVVGAVVLVKLRSRPAAPAPTWVCGQPVDAKLRWSGAGFTKPLLLSVETILRPTREVVVREESGLVQEVTYSGEVPHLIDVHLYEPVSRGSLAAAAWLRRLQSGNLGVYAGYLIALILAILLAARLGAFG